LILFFLVDISVYKHGFHSDLNETFLIGNVDKKTRDLVRTAYGCLEKAMEMSKFVRKQNYSFQNFISSSSRYKIS
jgi:methionine aminopeptidase